MTSETFDGVKDVDYQGVILELPNVAFCGRMGAGKTTAAQFLEERFGYRRVGFADAVRDVAERVYGPEARRSRTKLIAIGKGMREIDPDIWVTAAVASIGDRTPEDPPIVIDDLRFPNEYWRLKEECFVICRVAAEEALRVNRLQIIGKLDSLDQLEDESETALDGFHTDYVFTNQGETGQLELQVLEMLYKEANRA